MTSLGMWVLGHHWSPVSKGRGRGTSRALAARHEFDPWRWWKPTMTKIDIFAITCGILSSKLCNSNQMPESTPRAGSFDRFLLLLAKTWGKSSGQKNCILTHANNLLTPLVPLLLGAKYLAGDITLGDLVPAAAAFLQVQLSLIGLPTALIRELVGVRAPRSI
jgi:hypothetical protein